jgi:hypothetical protein
MLKGKVQQNSMSCTHNVNFKVLVIKNLKKQTGALLCISCNRMYSVLEETKDLSLNRANSNQKALCGHMQWNSSPTDENFCSLC